MKPFLTIIEQQVRHYRQWNVFTFTILTLLSVLSGQTTVFYLIYFFWWNEFIRIIVDRLYYKRNKNAVYEKALPARFDFGSFLQMGIYFIFIIVFFGFIASSDNTEIIIANMGVLFFQNWFFNINLILVLFERLYLHKTQQPLKINFGIFTPNMIVLHVSIIVGAGLMFFIVKRFPAVFTPDNLWGSALIALPFLLLKMGIQYLTASDEQNKHRK